VRRAIRAAKAKLFFLPPYSLNPIEHVFAMLKIRFARPPLHSPREIATPEF
jgi:transposase